MAGRITICDQVFHSERASGSEIDFAPREAGNGRHFGHNFDIRINRWITLGEPMRKRVKDLALAFSTFDCIEWMSPPRTSIQSSPAGLWPFPPEYPSKSSADRDINPLVAPPPRRANPELGRERGLRDRNCPREFLGK